MTYFGQDRLTKDITLDDLDEEDIDLLRSGLFHIQNEKDRSGRFIVYLFNHMLGNCTAKALVSESLIDMYTHLHENKSLRKTK